MHRIHITINDLIYTVSGKMTDKNNIIISISEQTREWFESRIDDNIFFEKEYNVNMADEIIKDLENTKIRGKISSITEWLELIKKMEDEK